MIITLVTNNLYDCYVYACMMSSPLCSVVSQYQYHSIVHFVHVFVLYLSNKK